MTQTGWSHSLWAYRIAPTLLRIRNEGQWFKEREGRRIPGFAIKATPGAQAVRPQRWEATGNANGANVSAKVDSRNGF